MFVYQSRFLRRGEVWFDNEPDSTPVDWIVYRQCPRPRPRTRQRVFQTRVVDLIKSSSQLLGEMEVATLEKISRAEEGDRVRFELSDPMDPEVLNTLERMWNDFMQGRRQFARDWLMKMAERNALMIARGVAPDGNIVTCHAIYKDRIRAQQLMMVSSAGRKVDPLKRAITNRANCLLIWKTMGVLKAEKYELFDFAGWYPGTENIAMLGMNAFKKGFGGRVISEYECQQICTIRAAVFLSLAALRKKIGVLNYRRKTVPKSAGPRTGEQHASHTVSAAIR